jgi:hypothetical protein
MTAFRWVKPEAYGMAAVNLWLSGGFQRRRARLVAAGIRLFPQV